jgi:hypothetical protein
MGSRVFLHRTCEEVHQRMRSHGWIELIHHRLPGPLAKA